MSFIKNILGFDFDFSNKEKLEKSIKSMVKKNKGNIQFINLYNSFSEENETYPFALETLEKVLNNQIKNNNENTNTNNNNQVNINYDPNKITQNLILELANKIANRDKKLYQVRTECKNCFENIKKIAKELDKEYKEIEEKYNIENQLSKMPFVIYNGDAILKEIKQKFENAKKMIGVPFCKEHKQLEIDLQNSQFEIEALEHSIKLISK